MRRFKKRRWGQRVSVANMEEDKLCVVKRWATRIKKKRNKVVAKVKKVWRSELWNIQIRA